MEPKETTQDNNESILHICDKMTPHDKGTPDKRTSTSFTIESILGIRDDGENSVKEQPVDDSLSTHVDDCVPADKGIHRFNQYSIDIELPFDNRMSTNHTRPKPEEKNTSLEEDPDIAVMKFDEADMSTAEEIDMKGKKTRRSRTTYTTAQLDALERFFQQEQYPDLVIREQIADKLKLDEERVQIWFQNRRAKYKRTQKEGRVMWMRQQIYGFRPNYMHPAFDLTQNPYIRKLHSLTPQGPDDSTITQRLCAPNPLSFHSVNGYLPGVDVSIGQNALTATNSRISTVWPMSPLRLPTTHLRLGHVEGVCLTSVPPQ